MKHAPRLALIVAVAIVYGCGADTDCSDGELCVPVDVASLEADELESGLLAHVRASGVYLGETLDLYHGTSHLLTPDHFDFSGTEHRIFHLGLPGIHNIMDGPWEGDANGWVTTLRKARAAGLQTNLELVREELALSMEPGESAVVSVILPEPPGAGRSRPASARPPPR